MNKFLRRETARSCPIHIAVTDEAAKRLEHSGVFSTAEVLDSLNFGAIDSAIRWDYVREFLQEMHGCELVPLAESFFKRHKREEELFNPSRFIATGYGKKTAGYAAVIPKNDHLVIARVKQRKRMANGAGEAFQTYVESINRKRNVSIAETETHQIPNQ